MTKQEVEVWNKIYDCMGIMSTLNPPNPAHLEAKLHNQRLLYKAARKIRVAMAESVSGKHTDAIETLNGVLDDLK